MQKLNLNNIPEAPENKDFWVVGTANREGSIDSNSYKKNLAKIGGNLEDMTASITAEQKNLIRKNLGLYYESMEQGEKTAKWTDEEFVNSWAKISDDTPAKEDLISIGSYTAGEAPTYFIDEEGGYSVAMSEGGLTTYLCRVITEGGNSGLYVYQQTASNEITYNGPVETASKIDSKFLPEIDERELIRRTISTIDPLKRIIFWEDLVPLSGRLRGTKFIGFYGVKDSADLEGLSKMPVKEDDDDGGVLMMHNSSVLVEFKALTRLVETGLNKISSDETPTYTILKDTLEYASRESAGDTSAKAWDLSNFVSGTGVGESTMNLEEFPDAMRESAPFPIPDEVRYFLQIQLGAAVS